MAATDSPEIPILDYPAFYAVASNSLQRAIGSIVLYKLNMPHEPNEEGERLSWLDLMHALMDDVRSASAVTIVFSAFTLESYINFIARETLSKWYQDSVDKLEISAKWLIVPQLAFGKCWNTGDSIIQRIKTLQFQRNRLAHSRNRNIPEGAIDLSPYILLENDARAAFATCTDAIEMIQEFVPAGCKFNLAELTSIIDDRRLGLNKLYSTPLSA